MPIIGHTQVEIEFLRLGNPGFILQKFIQQTFVLMPCYPEVLLEILFIIHTLFKVSGLLLH